MCAAAVVAGGWARGCVNWPALRAIRSQPVHTCPPGTHLGAQLLLSTLLQRQGLVVGQLGAAIVAVLPDGLAVLRLFVDEVSVALDCLAAAAQHKHLLGVLEG